MRQHNGRGAVTRSARCALVAVGLAALLTSQAGATTPDRHAKAPEMRQFRAALVIAVDATVKGPVYGRTCWATPRKCRQLDVPEIVVFNGKEWAEAWFLIDGKAKEVDFERKLENGAWRARAGAGFRPPLPCAVLRRFERPCP
jgi:hypothetical protein